MKGRQRVGGQLRLGEIVCFGLVGVTNTVVGFLAILFFMKIANLAALTSNIAGYGVGMTLSYLLNKRFTFEDRRATRESVFWFIGAAIIAFASNLVVLFLASDVFGLDLVVAQALAVLAYACVFFLLNRWFVFARAGRSRG